MQPERDALQVFLKRIEGQRTIDRVGRGGVVVAGFVQLANGRPPAYRQPPIAFALNGDPVVEL